MSQKVQLIIDSCKLHFTESVFKLEEVSYNKFAITGDNISKAINHYDESRHQVNVLHWFDEFWIYMEITFLSEKSEKFPQTFITISIYQGEADDEYKNQLFRAEWDSFENNVKHPQPHWHIYPFKYHHKIYEDFETYNSMKEEVGFEMRLKNNFTKIIDIRKMHFAMNAQWSNKLGHIHELPNLEVISNWIQGVLEHIKYQLLYIKKAI